MDLLEAIDLNPWPQRSQGVRCRRRTSGTTAGAMAPRWWRRIPLCEASDRLCGKRLQALLPLLVESLKSHDRPFVGFDPQAERRQRLAQPAWAYSAVRRRVPVRTFKAWGDQSDPGWLEIDLVAHCGGRMARRFLWTLMATDVATGWSECLTILMRDGALALSALQLIRRQLP